MNTSHEYDHISLGALCSLHCKFAHNSQYLQGSASQPSILQNVCQSLQETQCREKQVENDGGVSPKKKTKKNQTNPNLQED